MSAIVNDLLDKAKGKSRIDVVDDFAYPLPVDGDLPDPGVPLEDEPTFHGWIADMMAGADLGPESTPKRERPGGPRGRSRQATPDYLVALVEMPTQPAEHDFEAGA